MRVGPNSVGDGVGRTKYETVRVYIVYTRHAEQHGNVIASTRVQAYNAIYVWMEEGTYYTVRGYKVVAVG